jgi:hypothetical protein
VEKRRAKRVTVNLRAERISGNEKYAVFIENISETGIHMITTPTDSHKKYSAGTDVNLHFRLASGEILNLHGKVRWAYYRVPPEKDSDSIGLELVNPPAKYIEFVKTL